MNPRQLNGCVPDPVNERRRSLVLGALAAAGWSGSAQAEPTGAQSASSLPGRIPADPDLGPKSSVVRDNRRRMLFYLPQYEFRGPTEGLVGARPKATPILYIPPSQHTVPSDDGNVFDHSEAGIEAGAERAFQFIRERAARHSLHVGVLDLERYPSVNLPVDLDYDPERDRATVIRYLPLLRDEAFRRQAVRYHRLMASAMFRRLRAEMPGFELGWYNIPRTIGWFDQEPDRVALQVERTYSETYEAVLKPFAAFTGPGSQMIVTARLLSLFERGELGEDEFINWKVRSCRVFKEKLGPDVNIVTTIWPRWFVPGSPRPGPIYPGGDAVVPPGFMTRLCQRLLDESGVSGFLCWRASTDDDQDDLDPGFARRLSDRWAEVAAVVDGRSDFGPVDFPSAPTAP